MRGGKREGSGRPGKYQNLKTKSMKLPEIFETEIKKYAAELSIEYAIKEACTQIAEQSGRVYLFKIRSMIDIEPEKLNSILLDMSDKGILSLYMQEDPIQLTPEIEAGSFKARGETYHIIYLK